MNQSPLAPTASRSFDRRVAEILGYTIIDVPFVPSQVWNNAITLFTDEARVEWRKVYPNGSGVRHIPLYSTDRYAAWEILSWLVSKGYDVNIYIRSKDLLGAFTPMFFVRISEDRGIKWRSWEQAGETFPLAACRVLVLWWQEKERERIEKKEA